MPDEITPEEVASAIEALLFISGEPLDVKTITSLLECDEERTNLGLDALTARISVAGGLKLLRAPEGVQLVTSDKQTQLVDRFLKRGTRDQLSPAASETLAIVAYRGPIHRAGVEAIRGVNCSFTLRLLAMRGLVDRFSSEKDSRIFLYRVNAEFLRHLGLVKIEDLPDYQNFRQHEGMTNLEKMADIAVNKPPVEEETK
ncbi:MAG: SMC-Scp complex subunit ScpB [bacterium]|nr:SMC-Scp complex subunit ScpB [bacterium]